MASGCLVNTTEDCGTDMELNQMEQEAVVVQQLEWLLKYELKHDAEDHDWELINSLVRVLNEFKVDV